MTAQSQTGTSCTECQLIKQNPNNKRLITISEDDFIRMSVGAVEGSKLKRKKMKEERVHEFIKYVNALLNAGSGFIAIHTDDPHFLGLFDQEVDSLMLALISDDTFFHDNFERFYRDGTHIIFRVLPRRKQEPRRPPSTVSFKTKVSTDTGLVNPTHGQMRKLISRLSKGEKPQKLDRPELEYSFTFAKEVDAEILEDKKKVWFQENMESQAKSVTDKKMEKFTKDPISFCFEEIRLHLYVSALSKLPNGGSVYIGVREEKTEMPKWMEEADQDLRKIAEKFGGPGDQYKLYKDLDTDGLYHLANASADVQIPTKDQLETGQFMTKGVPLSENQQETLEDDLKKHIENNMKAYHIGPDDAKTPVKDCVRVKLHPVKSCQQPLFVIEVSVKRFQGILYTDADGPEAYKLNETDRGCLVEKIGMEEWHDWNARSAG